MDQGPEQRKRGSKRKRSWEEVSLSDSSSDCEVSEALATLARSSMEDRDVTFEGAASNAKPVEEKNKFTCEECGVKHPFSHG